MVMIMWMQGAWPSLWILFLCGFLLQTYLWRTCDSYKSKDTLQYFLFRMIPKKPYNCAFCEKALRSYDLGVPIFGAVPLKIEIVNIVDEIANTQRCPLPSRRRSRSTACKADPYLCEFSRSSKRMTIPALHAFSLHL